MLVGCSSPVVWRAQNTVRTHTPFRATFDARLVLLSCHNNRRKRQICRNRKLFSDGKSPFSSDIIQRKGFYMLHGMLTCIHIVWSICVYTVNGWTVYLVMQLYEKVNANFGSSVLILYDTKSDFDWNVSMPREYRPTSSFNSVPLHAKMYLSPTHM